MVNEVSSAGDVCSTEKASEGPSPPHGAQALPSPLARKRAQHPWGNSAQLKSCQDECEPLWSSSPNPCPVKSSRASSPGRLPSCQHRMRKTSSQQDTKQKPGPLGGAKRSKAGNRSGEGSKGNSEIQRSEGYPWALGALLKQTLAEGKQAAGHRDKVTTGSPHTRTL